MTWGQGNGGLGRKGVTPDGPHPVPASVAGVGGIRAVACDESQMLAITTAVTLANGTIMVWGKVPRANSGVPIPLAVNGLKNPP